MSHSKTRRHIKIAIVGTRGIPAGYGGFESFAQELSTRLVQRGHAVTVYGRSPFVPAGTTEFLGVRVRVLPCIRHKYLETVSHSLFSLLDGLFRGFDAVLVCNAANAPFCWIPRLAGQKVALNVDGIERMRKKWNFLGKSYYRLGEFLATLAPHEVVADARVIRDYYRKNYHFDARMIAYGAPSEPVVSRKALEDLGIAEGGYILFVSRLEPENNAHRVIQAYQLAGLQVPLVIVGSAPYGRGYIESLHRMARGDNILLPGAIYGLGYRELLSHCRCYIQATEVGGTHPALIEAMGAGCLVIANDTPENREVMADCGLYYDFNDEESLAGCLEQVLARAPAEFEKLREAAQARVREHYNWEDVVDCYERLFSELLSKV